MELGKLVAVFDADTKRFDAGLRHVQTKIGGVTKDLGRATASTHQLTGATGTASVGLSGLGGALGLAGGAAIGTAAAISAAAVGVHKLAVFSQQLAGDLFDLSTKINFSAETLSSLKVAAELSGGSLASLSTALGIFDRNIEEANDKTTEMSRIFKVLNIDTKDNEKALRQAFVQLSNMTSGAQQTALAMKLFGRSGKEVLGVVKETNGNIEEFTKQMGGAGFVTSAAAKKADEFDKRLVLLRTKLEDVARQIGSELVPTVEKAADDISRWLKDNQGEIIKTAKEIGGLIGSIYSLAKTISSLSPMMLEIRLVRKIIDVASGLSAGSAQGAAEATARQGGSINAAGQRLPTGLPTLSPFRAPGRGLFDSPFRAALTPAQQSAANARRAQEALEERLRGAGAGGGRGGGGGGSARTDPGIRFLQQLEDQFRSLTPRTELQKVQEKLLGEEYVKTSDAIKRKIMITATEIDQQTKILGLTRERTAALSRLRRVLDPGLETSVRDRIVDPTTWGAGQRLRRVGEPDTTQDATRPRIATVERQVLQERMAMIHEQMMGLGQDLTSIFAQSIGDGFEQGAKRGLVTLAQGLLDIVQNIFLKKLAEGLGNILTNAASGGKGGVFGAIFGAIGAGLTGGIGGGAIGGAGTSFGGAFAGGFAKGGFVPPGKWGMAGERGPEPVYGGPSGMSVMPNSGQVVNNHYTINLPPSPKGGYTSPKSQRELGDKLLAMLQGSQA